MAVWIKRGVLGDLQKVAHKGLGRLIKLYREGYDLDFYITSIRDGNHSDASLHYIGMAFDFRQQGVPKSTIRNTLGPGWDVVFERTHVHAEYDPK